MKNKLTKQYRESVFVTNESGVLIDASNFMSQWGAGEYKVDLSEYNVSEIHTLFIPYLTFETLEKAYVFRSFALKKGISIERVLIGYCSYSRQERETKNEPALLPNILKCVKTLLGDNVVVIDGHDADSFKEFGIKNVSVLGALSTLVKRDLTRDPFLQGSYIVAPDKGAMKRNTELGIRTDIVLSKTRVDGKVLTVLEEDGIINKNALEIDNALPRKAFIILDDMCDGGRTFANAAEILKSKFPYCTVILCVTHAILPFGVELLKNNGITSIVSASTCDYTGLTYNNYLNTFNVIQCLECKCVNDCSQVED